MPVGNPKVSERPQHEEPVCGDWAWKCARCGRLIGYVDSATRTTIRLKYKDAFVWVDSPTRIAVPCRGCGAFNEITDDRLGAATEHGESNSTS
jgi:hypothetical protein